MDTGTSYQNRRRFLKGVTAGAAAPFLLPSGLRAASPNGMVNHAAIGVDGQGWSDLQALATHPKFNLVAICDVDTARMAKAAEKFPNARKYQDFREMLDKEGDKIDSVNVTVPDHMHAAITMAAIEKGKHVYTQKPLTHNVAEARALRLAAKKAGVVSQMGNQIQSFSEYKTGVRWIRDGVIGKVKEIHAWSGAGFPNNGRPEGEDPVPETLNWDLWLGVAPERPYKKGIYHPFNWRGWQDFGGGGLGDFGCHILDSPFKATGIQFPTKIKATVDPKWLENEAQHKENFPDWEMLEYEFPGTEFTTDTVNVTWYDGTKQPDRKLFAYESETRRVPGGGSLFIGEGGQMVLPHYAQPQLLPRKSMAGRDLPKEKQGNHYHAFIDACLGKGTPTSNFDFAGPLSEAVLLGRAAHQHAGKELEWDAAAMKITNLADANKWIGKEDRKGW